MGGMWWVCVGCVSGIWGLCWWYVGALWEEIWGMWGVCGGYVGNKHSTDVELTPPPLFTPHVHMSIHPEGKSCCDLGSSGCGCSERPFWAVVLTMDVESAACTKFMVRFLIFTALQGVVGRCRLIL